MVLVRVSALLFLILRIVFHIYTADNLVTGLISDIFLREGRLTFRQSIESVCLEFVRVMESLHFTLMSVLSPTMLVSLEL